MSKRTKNELLLEQGVLTQVEEEETNMKQAEIDSETVLKEAIKKLKMLPPEEQDFTKVMKFVKDTIETLPDYPSLKSIYELYTTAKAYAPLDIYEFIKACEIIEDEICVEGDVVDIKSAYLRSKTKLDE